MSQDLNWHLQLPDWPTLFLFCNPGYIFVLFTRSFVAPLMLQNGLSQSMSLLYYHSFYWIRYTCFSLLHHFHICKTEGPSGQISDHDISKVKFICCRVQTWDLSHNHSTASFITRLSCSPSGDLLHNRQTCTAYFQLTYHPNLTVMYQTDKTLSVRPPTHGGFTWFCIRYRKNSQVCFLSPVDDLQSVTACSQASKEDGDVGYEYTAQNHEGELVFQLLWQWRCWVKDYLKPLNLMDLWVCALIVVTSHSLEFAGCFLETLQETGERTQATAGQTVLEQLQCQRCVTLLLCISINKSKHLICLTLKPESCYFSFLFLCTGCFLTQLILHDHAG